MENIIKELIHIEERAREIAHASKDLINGRSEMSARRAEDAKKAIREAAALESAQLEAQYAEQLSAGLAAIERERDGRLEALRRGFEANKSDLAREIFTRITGAGARGFNP